MSKLDETRQAYDELKRLLDRELLTRRRDTAHLRKTQEALDAAFYLLGWGQFEHLSREAARERIEQEAAAKGILGIPWQFMKKSLGSVPIRTRLDIVFHADPKTRATLDEDYEQRNEIAHNYKLLPKAAKIISDWLRRLDELVDKF